MKCKQAKQQMALSAGRDLDPAAEQELRRHLTTCPNCHAQWNRVCSTTSILQQSGLEAAEVSAPQLWPSVLHNLRETSRGRTARSEPFSLSNTLVPLVAVASLMLAVVSIRHSVSNPPPNYQESALIPVNSAFPHGDAVRSVEHRLPGVPRQGLREASAPLVSPPSGPIHQYYRDQKLYEQAPWSWDLFNQSVPDEARLNRE